MSNDIVEEQETEDFDFDFGWQTGEACISFDSDTKCDLERNPLYDQISELFLCQKPKEYNHIFIDWDLLFLFIVFSFENLTTEDIREEFESLSENMNHIVEETETSRFVSYFEIMFYDLLINKFLGTLRRTNIRK